MSSVNRWLILGSLLAMFFIINSSQFVLAGGSLLLVRRCGYRLTRGRRKLAKSVKVLNSLV